MCPPSLQVLEAEGVCRCQHSYNVTLLNVDVVMVKVAESNSKSFYRIKKISAVKKPANFQVCLVQYYLFGRRTVLTRIAEKEFKYSE